MRTFTEKEALEIYEAEKGLREAGFDVDHEGSNHNATLIMDHFEKNAGVPVTVASIYALVNQRPNDFKWRTPAQREYDKIAAENPAAAQQLAAWLATQGKAGQLVNTGDEAFVNSSLLLIELRGRTVDSQRIHEAMGRISYRPGRQLHWIPLPRTVDPRQHKDDGSGFLSKKDVNKSPLDYKREADAAYANPVPTPTNPTGPVDEWETIARSYLGSGGSHGRNANLQSVFDRGVSGELSWRQVAMQMGQLKKSYSALLPTARY
jgi:hypothetical protein